MINQEPLSNLLVQLDKEKSTAQVAFIIPAGVLLGRFKSYDHKTHIINITHSVFSNVSLDMEMSFPMEIVQAWGK